MCGRFTHRFTWRQLHALLSGKGIDFEPERFIVPRHNVAPQQAAPVLIARGGRHELLDLVWGFAGPGPSTGTLINARAETMAQLPTFRDAFKAGRAVIPASGFYEWDGRCSRKQPHYFTRRDGEIMLLAGLWRLSPPGSDPAGSFVIATTAPSDDMDGIHNRMPAILDPSQAAAWLDPASLPPVPGAASAGTLGHHPVNPAVGSVRNDGPELIASWTPPNRPLEPGLFGDGPPEDR